MLNFSYYFCYFKINAGKTKVKKFQLLFKSLSIQDNNFIENYCLSFMAQIDIKDNKKHFDVPKLKTLT